MVKHIIVVSDNSRDNITVYTEEPAFVSIADRTDMNALKELDEANKAGIYILMGEDKRYVGQASTSIYNRLSQHHKQKDWWHQVIFFGREDGHLDKSQTDYLENLLIKEFRQTSFKVVNNTDGNTSWIDKTSKIQADKVWNIAQNILQEVANIDLFENSEPIIVEEKTGNYFIQLSDGHNIYGKNPSNNYLEFFKYLLSHNTYSPKVRERIMNGKTNSKYLLGTEPRFDRKSNRLSTELEENIHLLTTLSTADKKRVLLRFADQIGLGITINWD